MTESRDGEEGAFTRRAVLAGTAVAAAGALTSGAAAQEITADVQRGSERLLEQIGSGGHTFSADELRQVIGVFRKHNGRFIDWCQYGQPGIDGVCGRVIVGPKVAGQVLTDLLATRDIFRWRVGVFPKGIPALDHVLVRLQAGREGGVIIDG